MKLELALTHQLDAFRLKAELSFQGNSLGLFGPSGSGKSTLAGLIAGLARPQGGYLRLDGDVIFDSNSNIHLPPEQRRIALVFQHSALFPHMTVRGNLLYGFNRRPPQDSSIDIDSVSRALGLSDLLERGVNNLSGGERQRVAIGRAVLSSPRLLLMDEPLSALDDDSKFQIISYLKATCARFNIPFIFISHSLVEMRMMTDTAAVIAQGGITSTCSTEALARTMMERSPVGYINILGLSGMSERAGLCAYNWNGGELLLSKGNRTTISGLFELSSKDIILFKKHPEAISARNLLQCTVVNLFESGTKMGVELDCNTGRLIAEIVPDAGRELDIVVGSVVHAAIKASAFRRLATTQAAQEQVQCPVTSKSNPPRSPLT
ncbi:MAG: molybdenum ABC transporter ATP-binding protein [Desulfuromonadales bacterium GWD2_54_10]|nr:MAG: molybdenum ABC transporter ATP-binding protein [Desulfuromonadales bacterium GWD2_54_10]